MRTCRRDVFLIVGLVCKNRPLTVSIDVWWRRTSNYPVRSPNQRLVPNCDAKGGNLTSRSSNKPYGQQRQASSPRRWRVGGGRRRVETGHIVGVCVGKCLPFSPLPPFLLLPSDLPSISHLQKPSIVPQPGEASSPLLLYLYFYHNITIHHVFTNSLTLIIP